MSLTTVYLALGSNLGERFEQMRSALQLLQGKGIVIVSASPVYQNRAVGMGEADPFLNAVVEVQTSLKAEALLDVCLATENQLGRMRARVRAPRTIDIDVLMFGETSIETERLHLPHPSIAERDFVLRPLVDIAPDLELQGQPVKLLLDQLPFVELELVAGSLF